MGQPRPLFRLFSSFRSHQIWTQIVVVEGENADHSTTTMALLFRTYIIRTPAFLTNLTAPFKGYCELESIIRSTTNNNFVCFLLLHRLNKLWIWIRSQFCSKASWLQWLLCASELVLCYLLSIESGMKFVLHLYKRDPGIVDCSLCYYLMNSYFIANDFKRKSWKMLFPLNSFDYSQKLMYCYISLQK